MNKQDVLRFFKEINFNTEDDKDGKNYRYFHPLRILKLARELADAEKIKSQINDDHIFLLALFHDIGRNAELVKKHALNSEAHDENNIVLFGEYINIFLNSPEEKEQLSEIVSDFSRKQYQKLESKLVRDADNLDEIGLLNFWRMAVYAGKHGRDPKETVDFYLNVDRQDKIQKMEKKLNLKTSRLIAVARLKEMDEIMEKFRAIVLDGSEIVL